MKLRPNLIQKRKNSHLTQSEMAGLLHVTIRHYKSLEAGTSNGSVKIWQQLAQKFNTTIDSLLEQDSVNTQQNSTMEEVIDGRQA